MTSFFLPIPFKVSARSTSWLSSHFPLTFRELSISLSHSSPLPYTPPPSLSWCQNLQAPIPVIHGSTLTYTYLIRSPDWNPFFIPVWSQFPWHLGWQETSKYTGFFFFFLCGPQTSKPKCLWPYHPLQWLLELVWKGGSHIYFPKVHKYICSAGLYSITSTNKGSYQAVCTVRLFESYHFLNPAHAWNFGLMIRDRRNFFQLL